MFRVCIYAYIYIYVQDLGSRVVHIHTCIHAHTHTQVRLYIGKYEVLKIFAHFQLQDVPASTWAATNFGIIVRRVVFYLGILCYPI